MADLARLVTIRMSSIPAATASSMMYWITGLSTMGSISLGTVLVAGSIRVPSPAAGMTALRTFITKNLQQSGRNAARRYCRCAVGIMGRKYRTLGRAFRRIVPST
ncbi:Uncharacterised protein [Flavonifractor plautii]|uniref:Uncharacterized protein n=1 Tax=Flavonifractor plautii TaxID=292800 RepID=A0A174Q7V4_FLAPL|nr:Uncharacterised protein [Flavonifractor plautii]